MRKTLSAAVPDDASAGRIAQAIADFLGRIPKTGLRRSRHPDERARSIANAAAAKAALAAGALALPPGPLGWLTILPELVTIWRIQAQMVSDIAGIYGQQSHLTREHMLYCLFRHAASQAVRDLVVRVGERLLVQQASQRSLQSITRRIGVRISQRVVGKSFSRWLPVIGALGVGAYAYYDTGQVARTAIGLFQQQGGIDPADAGSLHTESGPG